jgi:hypothetical protein
MRPLPGALRRSAASAIYKERNRGQRAPSRLSAGRLGRPIDLTQRLSLRSERESRTLSGGHFELIEFTHPTGIFGRRGPVIGGADPLPLKEVSQARASTGNAESLLAGTSESEVSIAVLSASLRRTRGVANAREYPLVPKCTRLVPAKNQNLAITGNTTCPFAGFSFKPSDGLEPSTPSLPFWMPE